MAVADSFSVSRAAAELHISQSAVTSAIRELETELGAACSSAIRAGHPHHPGSPVSAHARRILGAMTEAGQSLKAVAQQDQGRLTIRDHAGGRLLPVGGPRPLSPAFPAVQIEVKEDEQPYLPSTRSSTARWMWGS